MNALNSIVGDGAVFALAALGIVITFYWGKVADLTPEASFTWGAVGAWLASTQFGLSGIWLLVISLVLGAISGIATFCIATVGVPFLMSSLIIVGISYSVSWVILGGPLAVLRKDVSLFDRVPQEFHVLLISGIVALVTIFLWRAAVSKAGLLIRATCECPYSVPQKRAWSKYSTLIVLALGNGLVGLGGGLFASQSYFIEINMGTGMLVSGLGSFLLGWAVLGFGSGALTTIFAAVTGAMLLRGILIAALANDVPAEWFRALSSVAILFCLLVAKIGSNSVFRGLRL